MLRYELKKIFNSKLILAAIVFSALFFYLFLSCYYFNTSNFGAEDRLCTILMKEYGTKFPVSDMGKLEQIRQKYIDKMDEYIRRDNILISAGITNYEKFEAYKNAFNDNSDHSQQAIINEINDITFDRCGKEMFLIQQIEIWQDWAQNVPFAGLDPKKAGKNVKENIRRNLSHEVSDDYKERLQELYTRNYISLLSEDAARCVMADIPLMGMLILICSAIFIIPYQIRERICNVNTLFFTTKKGRELIHTRMKASILATLLIGGMESIFFICYLGYKGILKYFPCPYYNTARSNAWFDLSFGEYVIAHLLLEIFIAVFSIILYFTISKYAFNYIVGFAIGIPVTIGLATFEKTFTEGYLLMNRSLFFDVYLPIILCGILGMIGIVLNIALIKHERKRDILIC